jgi:hypothetical protein
VWPNERKPCIAAAARRSLFGGAEVISSSFWMGLMNFENNEKGLFAGVELKSKLWGSG